MHLAGSRRFLRDIDVSTMYDTPSITLTSIALSRFRSRERDLRRCTIEHKIEAPDLPRYTAVSEQMILQASRSADILLSRGRMTRVRILFKG